MSSGSINSVSPDVQSVLAHMKAVRAEMNSQISALGREADVGVVGTTQTVQSPFANAFNKVLSDVNALQLDAGAKANAFVSGESRDLVGTMVAGQKASVAFQGVTQVRNRVVSAYQDIMNMPI